MSMKNRKKDGNMSLLESLYLRLYELSYMTGVYIIRSTRGMISRTSGWIRRTAHDLSEHVKTVWKVTVSNLRLSARTKLNVINAYGKNASDDFKSLSDPGLSPKEKASAFADAFRNLALYVWKILCVIFNYTAPILAAVLLFVTIQYFEGLNYGLAYMKNGKALCYIENENIYSQAEQIIRNRNFEEMSDSNSFTPSFSVVPIDAEYLSDADELANVILSNSGIPVYEGYGLYIDGELIGSTDESDKLLELLDEYREDYRKDFLKGTGEGNDGETEEGTQEEVPEEEKADTDFRLQFLEKIELVEGVYPTSTIKAISEFRTLFYTEVEGEKYYTVEAGDSPSLIADKADLYLSELYDMNPGLRENQNIRIGQQLVIANSVSRLSVTMTRREVYNESISFATNYTYNNNYYTTYKKTTKEGVLGEQKVTALVTYVNGMVVGRQVLQTEVLSEPVAKEVTVGTKSVAYSVGNTSGTSLGFRWPTDGGYVSCGFMGYKGHTGMDICGTGYGSNIYAAAAGTVVTVKWTKGGYGQHLIINHGGGIQTLYAHCSKIYVVVGQYVNKGDIIAAMGNTGNVTGTHLHFEIRINGQYVNPANYVSK